jgi:hypothetical protein
MQRMRKIRRRSERMMQLKIRRRRKRMMQPKIHRRRRRMMMQPKMMMMTSAFRHLHLSLVWRWSVLLFFGELSFY